MPSAHEHTSAKSAVGGDCRPLPEQILRICSFESRRSSEMRSLIERLGAQATVVPSMREIPLDDNPEVFTFADELLARKIDVMVFLTGVGARALAEAWQQRHNLQSFLEALAACTVVIRGPKPAAVLREWNVHFDVCAPEPNTWRELLAAIDAELPLSGKRVAVQQYGKVNEEFHDALRERGADVISVPVYRWALPEDVEPLRSSIRSTIASEFDVLMFTSANQLTNVLAVAEEEGLRDDWLSAAQRCVIASIGPTASETLTDAGLPPDVEASPPKMGHLVKQTVESAPAILIRKRPNR